MIERINEFMARRFGGVGTTRGSLLRIHAWALAFVVIVSALAPTHGLHRPALARQDPVHRLVSDPSDQRAFEPSPFGRRAFHVAWIFGSEGEVLKAKGGVLSTLGTFLVKSLPEIDHRKVVVDTYDLLGMRLGDIYMTLLDALAAKPDLVMLSLNPVWVMNPIAVHRWPNLDARAAFELAKQPAQWPIGAALLSPSDLLWGVTASQLAPFRERFYWSGRVHALVDHLGPLERSQLALRSSARRPDRSEMVLGLQPLTFWAAYRLHLIPRDQVATFNQDTLGPQQWAQWIDASNKGDNQMNAVLLRAIGAELRASGIPSVAYLAQANIAWLASTESFARAVGGVERQLAGFRGAFRAHNVLYQPQTLSRFVSGLTFKDETHLTSAGTIGPYFASQICHVLSQVGRGVGCRPVVGVVR